MQWTIRLEATTLWGELQTLEIGRLERRVSDLAAAEIGLMLDEAKALLAELQRRIVQTQIDEKVMIKRVCADCRRVRPIRDQRMRVLQTLFGTVRVAAPRIRLCPCMATGPFSNLSLSPLSELLADRCTPELRRLQAELGARHSFREAARLLSAFLPCSSINHTSIRNRLHRVADGLQEDEAKVSASAQKKEERTPPATGIVVLIDGAHVRAAPGYQARHLDVTVGKVEVSGRPARRFALASRGAEHPLSHVRAALADQQWTTGTPVTVISDGEAALPDLVRRATNAEVTHILDWWHISMRVRHAEQALAGICALRPVHQAGFDMANFRLGRVRHLLWNGYHDEVRRALFDLRYLTEEAGRLNGDGFRTPVLRFLGHCNELRSYLANNQTALVNYGARYRAGQPVSTSRAEACVDEIANARMARRQRMRWSPRGAHRVAIVRAAVLDNRLTSQAVTRQLT